MPPAEHFTQAPHWEWWILLYFVFGGIAGGTYALATLVRFVGSSADQRLSRLGYIVSFIALLPCPIFLILDLGQPVRFVNLMINMSDGGLMFKPEVPLSVGVWGLLLFGLFSFVSFLGALADGGTRALSPFATFVSGGLGRIWGAIGTVFGLFIAGYTGVLLSVSNQPVWSDSGWVLGGLFVASAFTGSAAILLALLRSRREGDESTARRLESADKNFALIEAVLVVLFLVSLAIAGTISIVLGVWLLLWLVVLVGLATPLLLSRSSMARSWPPLTTTVLTLAGLLALRALVIFAPQL